MSTVTISVYDADGDLESQTVVTAEELLQAHTDGTCHAMCGYCYDEGCRAMADYA